MSKTLIRISVLIMAVLLCFTSASAWPEPNITVVYPYSNEALPTDTSSVEINITTDINSDCEWNDTDINFAYGTGTAFTNGQGATQHSFTKSGLINGENYVYYYKCNNITGNYSSQSTVHNFSVYNDSLKITSNSARVYASEAAMDTYTYGFRNILDNRINTIFITYINSTWNDTKTFHMNFILPDRSYTPYEGIRNFSVSYFRYRCPSVNGCPDKFDIYADNTLILANKTIPEPVINKWINIDVPDTDFTVNAGNFTIVIKSVSGTGSQRIAISDIEIFSTEYVGWVSQSAQTGFVEIPMWWNNLQWATTFYIADVCNATWTVNTLEAQLGSIKQPLTLMVWGNDTNPLCNDSVGFPGPDYGNSTEITNKGHEYGTHSHDDGGGYPPYAASKTYYEAVTWANESRKDAEDNVYNTSRWSNNTVLSFCPPGARGNYHATEAIYDAGFRIAGQFNSVGAETNTNGWASISTSWRGFDGGINTTRDEKDWMHENRIGKAEPIFPAKFEERWNWTRDNGLFGDILLHCYGLTTCNTINESYLNLLGNDTVGWHATYGEVRSYYYYYQHMNLTYDAAQSTSTSKIYNVSVYYENDQDRGRIWRVPVTFGFNLSELGLDKNKVINYLETDLNLMNIGGKQTMAEGYRFDDDILYLSIKKDDGDTIIIKQNLGGANQCGKISTKGVYELNTSVFSDGTCMLINADDVVLDCQGNNITYANVFTGYGVDNSKGYNNVTIKNCNIIQDTSSNKNSYAIYYKDSENGTIQDNTITTSGRNSHGIYLRESSNSTIVNNMISTSGGSGGINLWPNSKFNTIENNQITNSFGIGISVSGGCASNIVRNNTIERTSNYTNKWSAPGILLADNSNNILKNNNIALCTDGNGIELINTHSNTVEENKIKVPKRYGNGISFALNSRSNIITNNIIEAEEVVDFQGPDNRNNLFYNNLFNNTGNYSGKIHLEGNTKGKWNNSAGGNYWTNSFGTGYSDTCIDLNTDGICDQNYTLKGIGTSVNYDYLPLTKINVTPSPNLTPFSLPPSQSSSSSPPESNSKEEGEQPSTARQQTEEPVEYDYQLIEEQEPGHKEETDRTKIKILLNLIIRVIFMYIL